MAVFGVPVVHEERCAARGGATAEMRESAARLNEELDEKWGSRWESRITAVDTGEVIAGDHLHGQPLRRGAGRERRQSGWRRPPGRNEILISAPRRTTSCAPPSWWSPSPTASSRAGETVEALRLVHVADTQPGRARQFDSPLVGRAGQLQVGSRGRVRREHSRIAPAAS